MKLQAPLAFAVAVPICEPPSNTLTVLPASAVPANVRRFALVIPTPTVPLSGENEVILGAAGATVSTRTLNADDPGLVLPAAFEALAVKLWVAFDSCLVARVQLPLALAVVVPTWVVPSNTAARLCRAGQCQNSRIDDPISHRAAVG